MQILDCTFLQPGNKALVLGNICTAPDLMLGQPLPRQLCTPRNIITESRPLRLALSGLADTGTTVAIAEHGSQTRQGDFRIPSSLPQEWSSEHKQRNQAFAERLHGKLILAPLTRSV